VGGRRLNDKHIQRTLPVESKGDCELFCEYEKEFRCEGFNFRLACVNILRISLKKIQTLNFDNNIQMKTQQSNILIIAIFIMYVVLV